MAGWFDEPPNPWDYPGQGGWVNQAGPTQGQGDPTLPPIPPQGGAVQPPQPGPNSTGRYTSADIASLFKKFTGRDATPQEARQWGDNIDQQYYDKIVQTISRTPEAQAYQKQQQNPTAPTGPTTPATGEDWAGKDYSNIDNVKAYFKSRGVDVSDQSAQYWADKYNSPEFNKDRGYFFTRLGQAEEFGGGGGGGYGDLLAPFTENFSYQDFKAPTQADLLSSPGFQSSLDRASNTLQRSAAAKGSLLSGSTAQALSDQTADLTTQGYGNLFNQSAQTYSTNRGNAYDAYKEKRANFYQNQDSPFAKLMALSSLQQQDLQGQRQINLGYAGLGSNNVNNGAAQYNGLLTGGANAAASGIVGSQNAYSSLYGNLSQYPWLLAAMRGNRGGGGSNYGIGSPGGYYGP